MPKELLLREDLFAKIKALQNENKKLKIINQEQFDAYKAIMKESTHKSLLPKLLFLELDKMIANTKFTEKNKDKLLAYSASIAVILNSKNSIDSNCAWKNIERADTLQEKLNSFEKENKKLKEELEEIKHNYAIGQHESHKLGWRQGIENFKEEDLPKLLAEFLNYGIVERLKKQGLTFEDFDGLKTDKIDLEIAEQFLKNKEANKSKQPTIKNRGHS